MNALILIDQKIGIPTNDVKEYMVALSSGNVSRDVFIGNDFSNPTRGDIWRIFSKQKPTNLLSNPVITWEKGMALDALGDIAQSREMPWLAVSSVPVISMALADAVTVVTSITDSAHPDDTFDFSSQPEMVMLDTFSSPGTNQIVRTYVCMPAAYSALDVKYADDLDFNRDMLARYKMLHAKFLRSDGSVFKVGNNNVFCTDTEKTPHLIQGILNHRSLRNENFNGFSVKLSGGYGPCKECLEALHERGIRSLTIDSVRARLALGLPAAIIPH